MRTTSICRSTPRWLALVAALVAALIVAAPAGAAEGDWRVGHDQKIDSPNPLKAYNTSSYLLFALGYDLLINFKTEDGTPDFDHSLATSLDVTPDGKTVTYHLRDGVKWSDGVPFTSDDVKWTFDTVLKNQSNVLRDYLKNVASTDAPDPLTVVLHMKSPDARVSSLFVYILPKHIWNKYAVAKIHATDGPQPAVTTAPWVLQKWDVNGTSVMTQNPNWWGIAQEGAPAIKRVLFVNYKNKDGQLQDLKLGKLDAILSGNARWVKELQGNKDVQTWPAIIPGFTEIAFNSCPAAGAGACTGPGPDANVKVVQDPAIRHALAWGIDRQALADRVYAGQADPGNGLLSQYYPTYFKSYAGDPDIGYTYDPAKAKQALADGGWDCSSNPCTKDGVKAEFSLLVRSTNDEEQSAAKLVRAWASDIGIKIDLQIVTEDAINGKIYASGKTADTYAPDYQAFLWGWGGDTATPDFNFDVLKTGSSWADAFYSNPAYDKLADEALQTVGDDAKRADLFHQAERIVLQDSPYVFLVHDKYIYLTRTDTWHGYVSSKGAPFGTNWLQNTVLKPGPEPAPAATTEAASATGAAAGSSDAAVGATSAASAGDSSAGSGAVTQEAAPASSDSSGGSNTGAIIGGAAILAVALLGGAFLLSHRKGGRKGGGGSGDWTEE